MFLDLYTSEYREGLPLTNLFIVTELSFISGVGRALHGSNCFVLSFSQNV